jgi:tetratricopeptide (TPR) repeat protein
VLLFYIFSRYRFPIVPLLILWAAFGIQQTIAACRDGKWTAVLSLAGVALAAGLFSNWRTEPVAPMVADTYYNLGCGLEAEGRMAQAAAAYRRALEFNPAHIMAMNNLGYLHQRQGDFAESLRWYESALRIDRYIAKLHVNLGMTFGALGRETEAIAHYLEAIRIDPDLNPAVYFNLACMYARRGESGPSLHWLGRAVARGFRKKAALLEDPDLEAIRGTAGYRAILNSIP